MSKRKLTYEDFKRYFSNNLPNKEKHAFEKNMMSDAFEDDAFDGLSNLSEDELEKDITELKSGIQFRSKSKKRIVPVWFRYAASVLVIVGIGLSIFVFLNHRLWQDSMNKEQFSQELEILDSALFDAEFNVNKTDSISLTVSTIEQEKPKLIADNKEIKKALKPNVKMHVVKDDVEISEDLILDEEMSDKAEQQPIEIMEFEKEEEIVEEQQPALAAIPEQKAAESEKQQTIVIRGSSSVSKSKKGQPVMVIDGKLIDPNKTKTIQGKILNEEDQLSIPGVSIVLKDMPAIGTVTDVNGEFTLTIPEDEELKTLIASFVGMETQEIKLEEDSNVLVYMEPELMVMDEVVVTDLGVSREKKSLGYSANDNQYNNETQSAQPSGEISILKYKKEILNKLDFSKFSQYPGKHKIKISIHVTSNGKISQIECENTPDKIFDLEIEKAIKSLGDWIPALENGQRVNSVIRFNLKIEIQ